MSAGQPQTVKSLKGKTVLLIGEEVELLRNYATQLAIRGADIALVSRGLPADGLRTINELVISAGRRFLFVAGLDDHSKSATDIIRFVISRFGSINALIDVSARQPTRPGPTGEGDRRGGEGRRSVAEGGAWSLTQAALKEIV